jgi:hypothetical protein
LRALLQARHLKARLGEAPILVTSVQRTVPALAKLTRNSARRSIGLRTVRNLNRDKGFGVKKVPSRASTPARGRQLRRPYLFPGDFLGSISHVSHWQSNSDAFSRPTRDLSQRPARCRASRRVIPIGWRRFIGGVSYADYSCPEPIAAKTGNQGRKPGHGRARFQHPRAG